MQAQREQGEVRGQEGEGVRGQGEGEYRFLQRSVRVKGEFDLRFDKIKGSLVTEGMLSGFKFLKHKLFDGNKKVTEPSSPEDLQILEETMPILNPNLHRTLENEIRYTWIGHSTAVIQVGTDNLLIDPVFADRCSPSSFFGPKRYRRPACSIAQLPHIHLVLVSHDHYDHLDEAALTELEKLHRPIFVAGLGSRDVFPKKSQLREMDWMDTIELNINTRKYRVTFVPVCHWSRRGAFDYNTRLWGGFIIDTPFNQRIFYSGDTAYTEVFAEIGHKFGPFDLSILPIGAYEPRELLSAQHVDPEEAVRIHLDLRSKKSVGVHWGTFPLGFERFDQPKADLEAAKEKLNVDPDAFVTVFHGQSLEQSGGGWTKREEGG